MAKWRGKWIVWIMAGGMVLSGGIVPAKPARPAKPRGPLPEAMRLLVDPQVAEAEKRKAEQQIVSLGLTAVPTLIASLRDQRPSGQLPPAPRGECMNLPQGAPNPCANQPMVMRTQKLGERCEALLYRIILPAYNSPFAIGQHGKDLSMRPVFVGNWSAWWQKYGGKSLPVLHALARTYIDQYWKQPSPRSPVEWR